MSKRLCKQMERKINLQFAADGRRTSNKIGTVMAVFSILEEENHGCDHQYPIALYNSKDLCVIITVYCLLFSVYFISVLLKKYRSRLQSQFNNVNL